MDILKARLFKNFKRQRQTHLDFPSRLPSELYYETLLYLSPRDLWRYRRVSRTFRDLIESYILATWLTGWCINPAVWITPPGQDIALPYRTNFAFQIVKATSSNHRDHYWDLLGRDGDTLDFRLPAESRSYHQFYAYMRNKYSWCRKLRLLLHSSRGDPEVDKYFKLPDWVWLLTKPRMKLMIQTPEFDIRPDAEVILLEANSPEVTIVNYAPAGFEVRYEGDSPALLINWRVLFMTMFINDEKLRCPPAPPSKPVSNFKFG